MIYDTLKLAEQLEHEAGFEASRAKSMARILAENTGGNLATREDVLVAKGELKTELQSVRTELKGEIQGLRVEMQDVRGDIRVLYWMIGTTLAGVVGTLSIIITIGLHVIHLE
ncbi:MAG TPA: hypothetical protein VGN43_14130 [Steroidobacteraceae bacterium]|nr:hypothetical protein [Steroidobacteraceae bacterium]